MSTAAPTSPVRPRVLSPSLDGGFMATTSFNSGTGRRKTAVARVRLLVGEGEIVVNGRSLLEHFGAAVDENDVRLPFQVTNTDGRFNTRIKAEGSGAPGQAAAVRHRRAPVRVE